MVFIKIDTLLHKHSSSAAKRIFCNFCRICPLDPPSAVTLTLVLCSFACLLPAQFCLIPFRSLLTCTFIGTPRISIQRHLVPDRVQLNTECLHPSQSSAPHPHFLNIDCARYLISQDSNLVVGLMPGCMIT